jgi:hypothetical protein
VSLRFRAAQRSQRTCSTASVLGNAAAQDAVVPPQHRPLCPERNQREPPHTQSWHQSRRKCEVPPPDAADKVKRSYLWLAHVARVSRLQLDAVSNPCAAAVRQVAWCGTATDTTCDSSWQLVGAAAPPIAATRRDQSYLWSVRNGVRRDRTLDAVSNFHVQGSAPPTQHAQFSEVVTNQKS